jgi:hypothetical protein
MNKKITSSVLAAVMIAGTTSFSAFAAMTSGTVVIGTKAFDLAYANDPAHAAEITNAVVAANGVIFVKDFEGNWIDNNTNAKVLASAIPAVTYKSATGVVTMFGAMDKDQVASTFAVSVIDVNKIQVKFNSAVDTEKVMVKLTKGLANYNVTTTWNAAKDTAVITSALSKLAAADYTVKVEGLTDIALTASVKVVAEEATSLVSTTTKIDVATSGTVYFNVLNQYGTKYSLADYNDLTVYATEAIAGVSFSAVTEAASTSTKGNLKATFTITDTDSKLKAGDNFKVTAVYKGLTTSSTVSFINAIGLAELSFGQVAPLKDKTRISIGDDDLVIPYTAVDQYGVAYELDLTENITWVSSNTNIVDTDTLAINEDGKLTVDTNTASGTAIVTAILEDGTTAQFSVTVEAAAYANTIAIEAPTTLLADGEKASLTILVYDQFGQVIPNKDVTGITFTTDFAINAKTLKLEGVVAENTALEVTATRTSDSKELASVTFAVEAEAVANTITAVNFASLYEVNATKAITVSNVTVKDQYGRSFTPGAVSLTEVDATNDNFSLSGTTVTALVAGTKVYTVAVDGSTSAVKNITLSAIASTAVTSYELAAIGTIYNSTNSTYFATPTLVGKTSDSRTVILVANKIASLTSSNSSVAAIDGFDVKGALSATAADSTATIKAWSSTGTLLGTAEVKVTNVTPVLTTIVATETLDTTIDSIFAAEDQYGVEFNEVGTWYLTNSDAVVVTITDGTDSLVAGDFAVKFVSQDGKTIATTTITVAP